MDDSYNLCNPFPACCPADPAVQCLNRQIKKETMSLHFNSFLEITKLLYTEAY